MSCLIRKAAIEEDQLDGFFDGRVPDRLRQLAMRRIWRLNPLFRFADEMVEYGEDFTDAATVIPNMQTAYKVGKGYLDKLLAEEEQAEAEAEAEVIAEEMAADDTVLKKMLLRRQDQPGKQMRLERRLIRTQQQNRLNHARSQKRLMICHPLIWPGLMPSTCRPILQTPVPSTDMPLICPKPMVFTKIRRERQEKMKYYSNLDQIIRVVFPSCGRNLARSARQTDQTGFKLTKGRFNVVNTATNTESMAAISEEDVLRAQLYEFLAT